ALVQIAAGYAKVESGVRGGALKLLARGLAQLQPFLPTAGGLALRTFADGVTADIERVRAVPETLVNLAVVSPPPLPPHEQRRGSAAADLPAGPASAGRQTERWAQRQG